MTSSDRERSVLVGLIRLRDHCTFTWRKQQDGGPRTVDVRANHCRECVAELVKLGYGISESTDRE
jgi:hypothetical protein